MKTAWNPAQYEKFLDARTRPARDLLSSIPDSFHPQNVCDLGCGTGNSTRLLKDRWPKSHIMGLDSSMEMLNLAKENYPGIDFVEGDIAHFHPQETFDCLFANACLQWLNHHESVIPALLKTLNAGGVFAMQMPNNFHSPSHQVTIQLLKNHPGWQSLSRNLGYGELHQPRFHLSWYYDLLITHGMTSLQLWESEYIQEMQDYSAIFEWVKGTALRPVLSSLNTNDQNHFRQAYIQKIADYYPLQKNNKILFPFRRIFVTGFKSAE